MIPAQNKNNSSTSDVKHVICTNKDEELSTEDLLYQYLQPQFVQQSLSPPMSVVDHEFDIAIQSPTLVNNSPLTPSTSPSTDHYFTQLQVLQQQQLQQHCNGISSSLMDSPTSPPASGFIDDRIQLQISSFSDLKTALEDIGKDSTTHITNTPFTTPSPLQQHSTLNCPLIHQQHHLQQDTQQPPHRRRYSYFTAPTYGINNNSNGNNNNSINDTKLTPEIVDKETTTTEEDLIHLTSTDFHVPSSIRLNVESSQMLDNLMERAVSHWCCIGFKVAPISLDVIRDWNNAPPAIVYCVASISLVTFMNHNSSQSFTKQAAMVFYEQARHKMDDVFVEDMQPMVIQAYFCLSYTSNLLRLYEQQRTWGGLASIALQQHAKDISEGRPVDRLTMMCWLRWYYVDAWMCLTLNRECLLADDTPLYLAPLAEQNNESDDMPLSSIQQHVFHGLYQFAALTQYMRMYIRAIRSGTIFKKGTTSRPSTFYQNITNQLKQWYSQQHQDQQTEIHFHLCYHAMRLVILFQFLHPTECPPHDILIDCLETNLALLQSLQYLREIGCDQSTYHHMFFAIHNTAKRIYMYNFNNKGKKKHSLDRFAEEQLRINLKLLRGTQAFVNDVFKVRLYAVKIEQQFRDLRIKVEQDDKNGVCNSIIFKNNTVATAAHNSNNNNSNYSHSHSHSHYPHYTAALSTPHFSPSTLTHNYYNTTSLSLSKTTNLTKNSESSLPATPLLHPNNNNNSGAPRIVVFRQKPLKTPTTTRIRNKSTSSHYDKIKKTSFKKQFTVSTCSTTKKKPQ
ncbi:hypothetical protein INT45_002662 [Circinella minor]|uniref:Transcription factor domain-containing protein n=1 Tax=Circinella minor TaxID=1195481 RepID=A0A8H7VGW5_9FUNG|nr:hypothetical protein INT45_002662 [Circinella minor]